MNEHRDLEDLAKELEQPLADFRGAVRRWSAATQPAESVESFQVRQRSLMPRLRLAAAGALVALLVSIPVYQKVQSDRRQAAELAKQDDALLQGVAMDLARSVPAPMEPLTQLVTFTSTKENK